MALHLLYLLHHLKTGRDKFVELDIRDMMGLRLSFIAELLIGVTATMRAVPQICNNEEVVTELLWDFFAQPLLKSAAGYDNQNSPNIEP